MKQWIKNQILSKRIMTKVILCSIKFESFFFSLFSCFVLFLQHFFEIIYNWKTCFINYVNYKTNSFCLLTRLTPPPVYHSKVESGKVCNIFGLQIIFNVLLLSLVHNMFFSLFIKIFSSMFLTFAISLIKDFNIDDWDLLEL